MRGTVLTDRSFPVQAVQVSDDSGQVAIVTFIDRASHVTWVRQYGPAIELRREIVAAAREALRERDAHMMRLFMSRMREQVVGSAGTHSPSAPVLSPGGRKLSFSFTHNALGSDAEEYEVIIRRKRPDPGQEG